LSQKPRTMRPGTVTEILKSPVPAEPEKAQIEIEGADDLYKEIRIENSLEDKDGKKVKLKESAPVSVTIEADASETIPIKTK
jgi:hypothetical protein